MHPILASRRRLLLYLAAWVPVAILLAVASQGSGRIAWPDAGAVFSPTCLVYAFVCLSPLYLCRARPLRLANLASLAFTFLAAALAGGLFLGASAHLSAWLWEKAPPLWAPLFVIGALLYLLSVGLHYAFLAMEASREAEMRAARARTLAREAELEALRMQLNPHFLFNSLHSISALATIDGRRARDMCIKLADFLRASLGLGSRDRIPLREEIALARSYLEVEQVRFGERLRVKAEIQQGCEECPVPPLLLQPLVENAVRHGIANLVEGGAIRLAAERRGEEVSITLENQFDPESPPRRSSGFGLAHVRRRLEVCYGTGALFDAGPQGEIYRVALRFPCDSPMAASSRA
jgi:two-component system sensor histidine kinase AlgZ